MTLATPTTPKSGRVRTPTILQMEATECGAAALGIILAHHGRWVPLEELRVQCGVSRDGASAGGIVRAARGYGLEAKGYRFSPDKVRALQQPCILFWNLSHFLVLEGSKNNEIYLNDPAQGPRTVTAAEFDSSFTGLVLQLAPGPNFTRGGEQPNQLRSLGSRLHGVRGGLMLAMLASLLLLIPGTATAGFTAVFVDSVLGPQDHWLWQLLLLMGLVALLTAGFTALLTSQLLRIETHIAVSTSTAFLRHVFRLPMVFFDQRQAADIANRVGLNDKVAQLLSRSLATAVVSALAAAFYAVLLLRLDLYLALIAIGVALLNVLAIRAVARSRKDANAKLQVDRGRFVTETYNGIQMIETIKATGRENDFFSRWASSLAKLISGEQAVARPGLIMATVPGMLALVNTAFILLLGSRLVIEGSISLGLLLAFQVLVTSFISPIGQLAAIGGTAQTAVAEVARLADVERYAEATEFSAVADPESRPLSGGLELHEVAFGYAPHLPPLIENFSLRLPPGARVALVGGSGSGKSTVARLITGRQEPWSGEVRFDGLPRPAYPRRMLAAAIGFVDQEIVLFAGSVRDNLTLWDNTVDDRVLIRALRDAQLYNDVMARPGGLDSVLAEGGGDLSGGQRQRLEIARALVSDPSILVLDEATSALDSETERLIDAALRRRGCTCVISAHRLSTIRDAEEIIVLKSGKIVERGTHHVLMLADGAYTALIAQA
ncbi:NHLP family bacteriocin export ABC transporter peptidase/permease/ATPase subunit [Cryobacterium aureum]|uniref:NHLP family bacteriocin export ABC transporter peptidase/permease/ATPase subunit n=1 Tax=Cryobacterium aureum TaxID=995037 RepID=UPI000CF3CA29|nr:NHLP family bacteriocin export ABC transporter peptidase/permease/ATPase subunit [Cryobacterium aureum]